MLGSGLVAAVSGRCEGVGTLGTIPDGHECTGLRARYKGSKESLMGVGFRHSTFAET